MASNDEDARREQMMERMKQMLEGEDEEFRKRVEEWEWELDILRRQKRMAKAKMRDVGNDVEEMKKWYL